MLFKRLLLQIPFKVTVALLLSFILPGIGIYSYLAAKELHSKAGGYPAEAAKKIGQDVKIEMTRFVNYSSQIIFSDAVQGGLPNYGKLDASSRLAVEKAVEAQFQDRFLTQDNFIGAEIITEEGEMIRYYVSPYFTFTYHDGSSDAVQRLKRLTDAKNQLPMWSMQDFPTGKNKTGRYVVLSRTIKSTVTNERLGIFILALREGRFSSLLKNTGLGADSRLFIIDSDGKQISAGNGQWDREMAGEITRSMEAKSKSKENYFERRVGSTRYSFMFYPLKDTDWHIVSAFPAGSYGMGRYYLPVYLVAAGLLFIFLLWSMAALSQRTANRFRSKTAPHVPQEEADASAQGGEAAAAEKQEECCETGNAGCKGFLPLTCRREVKEAVKYIEAHYAGDVLVEKAAREQYISASHLMHLFKEELGITFNEYLIKYRMKMSKSLLLDPRYKIYEVSEMVGYKNVKYFSQTFKKIVGVTPREYIKNHS